jgi:hypothetical protein
MYKIITKDLIIETDNIEVIKERIKKLESVNYKNIKDNPITDVSICTNSKIKDVNFQRKVSRAFFSIGSMKQYNRNIGLYPLPI